MNSDMFAKQLALASHQKEFVLGNYQVPSPNREVETFAQLSYRLYLSEGGISIPKFKISLFGGTVSFFCEILDTEYIKEVVKQLNHMRSGVHQDIDPYLVCSYIESLRFPISTKQVEIDGDVFLVILDYRIDFSCNMEKVCVHFSVQKGDFLHLNYDRLSYPRLYVGSSFEKAVRTFCDVDDSPKTSPQNNG